jgi:lysyl-tRNA synthetase class II
MLRETKDRGALFEDGAAVDRAVERAVRRATAKPKVAKSSPKKASPAAKRNRPK